ncbi:hypothetical protein ARMGADRAFT_1080260 [Armillaria gallica]|uniref:Uncharacterized protein n=1 Tax=Armillaria gallica TaxID=47427 RepID=A0A2H3DCX2_ARMGA|nr:hypothetical protein ARMGADRAFT_1080260 [Armillaria gallica]
MFSNVLLHESIYRYSDQLVEAEKQSYKSGKTAIAPAQRIWEELKELGQETASLTTGMSYSSFSLLGDALFSWYSTNTKASPTTPKCKHESSSSMAPVNGSISMIPHSKLASGMLQVITNINPLKVWTLSRFI